MRGDTRRFIAIVASALLLAAKVVIAEAATDEDLITLAHKKFGSFRSYAEKKSFEVFFEKIQDGEEVGLTPELSLVTDPLERKILTDPIFAQLWGEDRVIKAEWLKWVCIDPRASTKVTSRGIEISGARIQGKVDLAWAKIQFPLRTYKCAFTDDVILDRAKVGSLQLQSTCIQNLKADHLTTERDISFVDGFRAVGRVWLRNATINGTLMCDNGQFINPGEVALNLEGAKIGSVFLRNGFRAEGLVSLYSAVISGTLECDNGYFINPGAVAFSLARAQASAVLMRNGFAADGGVNLYSTVINGTVDCDDGHFINPGQTALNLEGTKIGSVLMRNGFEADGEVDVYSATISGNLECDRGQFPNPGAVALYLEHAQTGTVFIRNGFEAEGTVVLRGTKIDGDLVCDTATFFSGSDARSTGTEYAIDGDEINVSGSVVLRKGFRAMGTVWLRGAKIGGNLECSDGHFFKPGDWAINATLADIQGSIYLDDRFEANGRLSFQGSKTGQNFRLANVGSLETPILDLSFARAKALENRTNSWPRQDSVVLHGFVFDELGTEAARDAENQVNWIHLQSRDGFFSQPYEQMAAVFRGMGLPEEAVKVMIEKKGRLVLTRLPEIGRQSSKICTSDGRRGTFTIGGKHSRLL